MSRYLQTQDLSVTVLAPHPSFPHGTFSRTWKCLIARVEDHVRVLNLWTWQPENNNPPFASRMAYYLLFPSNAFVWLLFHHANSTIITSAPPIFTFIPGLLAKKLFNVRWILDVRDSWVNAAIATGFVRSDSRKVRISRRLEKMCYASADLICVTTHALAEELQSVDHTNGEKIKIVPNGVDTDFFRPVAIQKKNQIIYAGNVGHAQDLASVIIAMKTVFRRSGTKLLIVGDGDIKPALEELVKTQRLSHVVEFVPSLTREHLVEKYCESLLGLAPLKDLSVLRYAAPTKLYEYCACELPFVGSGKGEIENFAARSGAGVVAENSPEAISRLILALISDPERMAVMGKRGRAFVEKYYSRQRIAVDLRSYIDNLAA